jgi:hypothetical protein
LALAARSLFVQREYAADGTGEQVRGGQQLHRGVPNQYFVLYWIYATQQDAGAIRQGSRGNLGEVTPCGLRRTRRFASRDPRADGFDPMNEAPP